MARSKIGIGLYRRSRLFLAAISQLSCLHVTLARVCARVVESLAAYFAIDFSILASIDIVISDVN
jgi:hypothetical protein